LKKKCNNSLTEKIIFISSFITVFSALITLLFWAGYTPQDISLNFNKLNIDSNSNIFLEESVFSTLSSRYVSDRDEFIYCLYGYSDEEEIII
jgi:hypothetical protein